MKEHPVPQNIASYQFRLVGSMTLKQFLELAGGIVFAWILISSKLSPIIKWPIALFSGFFGAALAFFPIEERPLDQWIISFVKTLYAPTQFIWQKTQSLPSFLQPRKKLTAKAAKAVDIQAKDASLEAYLKTLPSTTGESILDKAEASYLSRVSVLFGMVKSKEEPIVVKTVSLRPSTQKAMGIKVRKLKPISQAKTSKKSRPLKTVAIPKTKVIKTQSKQSPSLKPEPPKKQPPIHKPIPTIKVAKFSKKGKVVPVTFSPQLPLPYKPKEPNLIVGMVFDAHDHILTNTIIEIKDIDGNPARALKTNKLGQFSIATPLKNGSYFVEAEHAEKHFDIMKLEVKGEIIPPIEIRSYD